MCIILLYAPSHRQDSTYHGLCYTSRGALAGTRNSSMGPPPHEGSIRRPIAPQCTIIHVSSKEEEAGNVLFNDVLSTFYLRLYGGKEGNVLFNDALNTFYLRLYGVRHMVKDHSNNERGNLLPPHGLFFPINSKGYFICIIP